MSDQLFIAYMTAFQVSVKHTADCEPCLNTQPCEVGDPIHDDFLARKTAWESEQRRQRRNADRRAKRRADSRARMARHAASELVAHGRWENGHPTATPADVADRASAMYSGHLKGELITLTEAAAALAAVIGN
ncbi:hypothetical protein [Streptomyces sp. NRRL S-495]|uniref:hypothetical protein n=1 Tax=Streptomyces sp. NRRL S-495 TaxID=1609133 RepID=UPI0005F8C5C0|nr:hypothetical protein [Streptomyces sp. NRRL S-495]KJY38129.1 hypothetical protein VR45_06800 [Streptomyces sp. NRRL S-495]